MSDQDDIERRNAIARAQNAALLQKVERVKESQKEILFSPQGLRGLFPTNLCSLKVKKITAAKPTQEN